MCMTAARKTTVPEKKMMPPHGAIEHSKAREHIRIKRKHI